MSHKDFVHSQPIVLGLCGVAGSGKTSTADKICPIARTLDESKDAIYWDHKFFAMPLYEMASIKMNVEGIERVDRILYGLHKVLDELMDQNIGYPDLVELVYDIYHMPCGVEGSKPRTFLQNAASLCRKADEDCFADYLIRKIKKDYVTHKIDWQDEIADLSQYMPYGTVVSDLRMINEAAKVKRQPNGVLIRFIASQEVLNQRLLDRDGVLLSEQQSNHESEKSLDLIPVDWFDAIINTDELTVEDQAQLTIATLHEILGDIHG